MAATTTERARTISVFATRSTEENIVEWKLVSCVATDIIGVHLCVVIVHESDCLYTRVQE